MRRGKGMFVVFLVLTVLVLVLAACAPATTPTPTPPPAVATPGPATPTPGAIVVTPKAGWQPAYETKFSEFGEWGMPANMPPPQYGGTFRMARGGVVQFYDTHRTYGCEGVCYWSLVMDGLIRYSPYMDIDIMPDTYREEYLAPNLAEKWEVSQDGLTVTFYLKKGVKWQDGKPFTAKDVKYSLDKVRDPNRSAWTADFAMVDRVEAVDDYTVKVYLKYPAARLFLLTMGLNQITMQAEHLKDVSHRSTDFLVGAGTGPFKFKSYTAGIEAVYEKNPDYHFKGRPYFDRVVQTENLTGTTGAERLAVGQADYYEGGGDEQQVAVVKKVAPEVVIKPNLKLAANLSVFTNFAKESPLQDVRVRKALTMIVDREAVCLSRFGGIADQLCISKVGYLVSPPAGRGVPYEEYEKAWLTNLPVAQRVPEAKKLLTEAGYPNGFKITWNMTSAPADYVLVIQDVWKRLINVESVNNIVARADWYPSMYEGRFELASTGSVAYAGAMEQLVNNIYIKGGQSNWGRYYHPVVEELYIKLISEKDFDKAQQIYHQIERILIQDVPVIPLYTWNHLFMYWPYIKPKFFAHPVWHSSYNGTLSVIWLDKNDPTYAKRAR